MNGSGVTVVKLGGSLLEDETLRVAALAAITARVSAGEKVVVVHGGGKRIDKTLAAMGIPKKVHEGLRVTDAETLDVVVSVLSGLVNKRLVSDFRALGVRSAGISGADAETLWAEYVPRVNGVDYGFVGKVEWSDPGLVLALLAQGLLPVVASVASGRDGTLLNVNADVAAAALAEALGARRLVFLTDVEGILDEKGTVLRRVDAFGAKKLLESGVVNGGMKPKLSACLEAIENGVGEVLIAGPAKHRSALENGEGGTRLAAA